MPHVIYLHSALTQRRVVGRSEEERREIFRFERIDVIIAMTIAGVINMSMLIMAAGGLQQPRADRRRGHRRGLRPPGRPRRLPTRRYAFGVALLASGLSSSSVGTLAGQVVMQGFIDRRSRSSCAAA